MTVDVNTIRERVRLNGCAAIDAGDLRDVWPTRSGSRFSWDVDAAMNWCRRNRIKMDVDPITSKVYFSTAGVYAPAIV